MSKAKYDYCKLAKFIIYESHYITIDMRKNHQTPQKAVLVDTILEVLSVTLGYPYVITKIGW